MRDNTLQTMSASVLIGMRVINLQGENLGEIEDLVLDLDAGRVAYAVLSFGGFLGLGETLLAVPWEALALDAEQEMIVLDADRRMLEDAPGFDEDHWLEMPDRTFVDGIYRYFGYQPYYERQNRRHGGAFTPGASDLHW